MSLFSFLSSGKYTSIYWGHTIIVFSYYSKKGVLPCYNLFVLVTFILYEWTQDSLGESREEVGIYSINISYGIGGHKTVMKRVNDWTNLYSISKYYIYIFPPSHNSLRHKMSTKVMKSYWKVRQGKIRPETSAHLHSLL